MREFVTGRTFPLKNAEKEIATVCTLFSRTQREKTTMMRTSASAHIINTPILLMHTLTKSQRNALWYRACFALLLPKFYVTFFEVFFPKTPLL